MGTSFVRNSGQEAWVCPYFSFPIGFFPSWIFLRGEMTVFSHQQRQERCPPLSAPCSTSTAMFLGGPTESFSPLPQFPAPSFSSLPVCMSSSGAVKGHAGPPSPMASLLSLPLMRLPAWQDIQGCPTDPSPGTALPVLPQGLISLAAATK